MCLPEYWIALPFPVEKVLTIWWNYAIIYGAGISNLVEIFTGED